MQTRHPCAFLGVCLDKSASSVVVTLVIDLEFEAYILQKGLHSRDGVVARVAAALNRSCATRKNHSQTLKKKQLLMRHIQGANPNHIGCKFIFTFSIITTLWHGYDRLSDHKSKRKVFWKVFCVRVNW